MSNEILKYLHDVREAAESIQNYLGDISDLWIFGSSLIQVDGFPLQGRIN